ncbi:MAG: hypothetical protein ACLFPP_01680 [Spirochaetaceae bacterium]
MKHTLLVPIRFLLVAIVVLLVVTLLAAAVDQGRGAGGQEAGVETSFMRSILYDLPVTVPVSLLVSVLIELFFILRKPGIPPLSLLLLFVAAAALQFGATFLFEPGQETAEGRNLGLFRPGVLLENREYTFSFHGRQGTRLSGVLLIRPEQEPAFSVHEEGYLDLEGERLLIPDSGVDLPLRSGYSPYSALFDPPGEVVGFVGDIRYFSNDLRRRMGEGILSYAAAVVSSTLLFVSFWTLTRATSWKLFNVLLVVLGARLFFLSYRVLNSDLLREITAEFLPSLFVGYLPSIVLGFLSILLLLLALLMPSLREWKRGVGDA